MAHEQTHHEPNFRARDQASVAGATAASPPTRAAAPPRTDVFVERRGGAAIGSISSCLRPLPLQLCAALAAAAVAMGVWLAAMCVPSTGSWRELSRRAGYADVSAIDFASDDRSPVEVLRRQLRQVRREGGHPVQELALHTSIGHVFRESGYLSDATSHYKAALGFAGSPWERAEALRVLGVAEMDRGHLFAAKAHLERAAALLAKRNDKARQSRRTVKSLEGTKEVDWYEGSFRDEDVSVPWALADLKKEMGHLDEALALYTELWETVASEGETADVDKLPLLAAEISDVHARRGDLDNAFSWLRQAMVQLQVNKLSIQGVDAFDEAKIQSYVATVFHVGGDIYQAREWYEKAAQTQASRLRPTSPELVATRAGMAKARRDLGDHAGALQAVSELEETVRSGPMEGPDLSRVLVLKADFLREQQRYEEAEAALEEAVQHQEACWGNETHPDVAVTFMSYGSLMHDQSKFTEAHAKYSEALKVNLATVGIVHPETAAAYNSLGTLSQDTNDDQGAEAYFMKCLEIQLRTVGERSPDVGNTYNNLATVLFRRGEVEAAASLFQKALRVLDAAGVPQGNPDRLLYEDNLKEVLSGRTPNPSATETSASASDEPAAAAMDLELTQL